MGAMSRDWHDVCSIFPERHQIAMILDAIIQNHDSPILITAACHGRMKLTPEQAGKAQALFGLTELEAKMLTGIPYRGSLPSVAPTDPVIHRFYALIKVYGTTWKAPIEEEFGGGIMSAIDFDMEMERNARSEGRPGDDHHVGQVPVL
jgi:cyanase